MNCQNCNTNIDYRFLTNCDHCEAEQASPQPIQPLNEAPPIESFRARLTWTRRLVNLVYVFISSLVGMVSGAVVIYFGTAMVCIAFLRSSDNASHDCARGNFIAVLAILIGAFLGTMGGSALAVKNPLCRARGLS